MKFYKILFNNLRSEVIRTDIIDVSYGFGSYLVLGPQGFGWRNYNKEDKEMKSSGNTSYFTYMSYAYKNLKKYQKALNKYLRKDEKKKLRLWLNIAEKYVHILDIVNVKKLKFTRRLDEEVDKKGEKIVEEGKELLKNYICLEEL